MIDSTYPQYLTIRDLRQKYQDWKKVQDSEKAKRRIVTVTTCKPCDYYLNSNGQRVTPSKLNLALH